MLMTDPSHRYLHTAVSGYARYMLTIALVAALLGAPQTKCDEELAALKEENARLRAQLAELKPSPKPNPGGWGKVKWGMSPKQVKKRYKEVRKLQKGTYAMISKPPRKIAGLPVGFGFYFVDNKLASVAVLFRQEYMNNNKFIHDFEGVDGLLKKKYGAVAESDWVWSQDLYKDSPDGWGTALAMGHLGIYSTWMFLDTDTRIHHEISGANLKITHKIIYSSITLDEQLGREKEREALGDL